MNCSEGQNAGQAEPVTSPDEKAKLHATAQPRVVSQIRRDVESVLESRVLPHGTFLADVENVVKSGGARLWHGLHRHAGVAVVGTAALAWLAADLIGVGELTLMLGIGYASYEVFRKGMSVDKALSKARV